MTFWFEARNGKILKALTKLWRGRGAKVNISKEDFRAEMVEYIISVEETRWEGVEAIEKTDTRSRKNNLFWPQEGWDSWMHHYVPLHVSVMCLTNNKLE